MSKRNKGINKLQAGLGVFMSVAIIAGLVAVVQNHKKSVSAASDASFSISPASGTFAPGSTVTVTVSETSSSSDQTDAIGVNLSYPASLLEYESVAQTGPFTSCAGNSAGSGKVVTNCFSPTSQSGTQVVDKITFKVLSTGTATVALAAGSDIDNAIGGGTSIWDGNLTSVNYTLKNTSSGGGKGTSSGGTGGSKSGTGSGSTSGSTAPNRSATGTHAGTSSSTSTTKSSGSSSSSKSTSTPTVTATPQSLGSISVRVKNKQGKFIAGATVILDSNQTATTNQDGLASFSAVAGGDHQLSIKAQHETTKDLNVQLTAGENKIIPITLAPPNSATIYFILSLIVIGMIAVYFVFRKMLQNRGLDYAGTGGTGSEDLDNTIVTSDSKSSVVTPSGSGSETVIKPAPTTPTPAKPTTPNSTTTTTIKPDNTKGTK